jgi:outer membrane protein
MKKLLFAAFTALTMFTATAQNKMGYINANELLGSMPEAAKAETAINEFKASLAQTYQDLVADLNAADSAFGVDSIKLSPTMKEIKRKELIDKYQRVQNFQQGSQEQMQAKQEEVLAPIREKAINAINATAKENGYGYIFNEENLLVKPAGDNILQLVKNKLGIKAAAPKAPAAQRPAAGGRK